MPIDNIDKDTDAVTFKVATTPDYETNQDGYSFTVVASAGSESTTQNVTIALTADVTPPSPLFDIPVTGVSGTANADTLTGTSAAEIIQGGNDDDIIASGGGGDVIIGGYGDVTITLGAGGAGADTLIYRFESDYNPAGQWSAADGGDVINNFRFGIDRLILVDQSDDGSPITSFAEFIADADKATVPNPR